MFAELRIKLECKGLDYRMSSNLHGVIMETIRTEYAEYLHQLQTNPFSQCLVREAGDMVWYIRTFNEEAYQEIIVPISKVEKFTLKKGTMNVSVREREIRTEKIENMMEEFYQANSGRYIEITFQTPTAFKSNGKYIFYPDLTLIFNSLMKRYSAVDSNMSMKDEETLNQLVNSSEIVRYKIRTVPFPMEGVTITGFQGDVCIKIKGGSTMAAFAKLLFRLGEYLGVGIKTGLGMGSIKIKERGDESDRSRN